ncbi:MAG: cysteine desulfurase [Demequinaceae bacterium]|nr:cysteine desulfurase [Demequinaceae bacterium]
MTGRDSPPALSSADPVYLDFNATTPVAPEVLDAMLPFLRGEFGNPSSDHPYGRRARVAVDRAREEVAALVGANPDEILFTSGGTESNNLAIRGAAALAPESRRSLVTTVLEHPATAEPCAELERGGWTVTRLPADGGIVDPSLLAERIPPDASIATAIFAQNETGAILPIAELAAAAHAVGAVVHADGAQAIGKIPVDVDRLGVDFLSIAGHKMYAPKGIGALYVRRGTRLAPLVRGAGQEFGFRPGTENVAYIAGLGAAATLAVSLLATEPDRTARLRDRLWGGLSRGVPGLVRLSPDGALPNTLLMSFPGVLGSEILSRAPRVAASTGSACHAGVHEPSTILLESGIEPAVALGAVRLSLGRSTTEDNIATAIDGIVAAYGKASQ